MSSAFFQGAWVALARYLVQIDALATPTDARAFLAPYAAALTPPPEFAFGAIPDPLVQWQNYTANLPPPTQPEIGREVRSWVTRVRDSKLYTDANADAADWYTRTQRAIALADDALPSVTDAASLKLAQVLVLLQNAPFLVVLRTFVAPPPQPQYQPDDIPVYPAVPGDPAPPPIVPPPVPLDYSDRVGVLPLAQRWALVQQRLQQLIALAGG